MHHGRFLALLLLALWGCSSESLEQGDPDRALVLSIGQLQPYGLSLPDDYRTHERFTRERWIDGSVTIEYEFRAPEQRALPYLYTVAERHPSRWDACTSFQAGNLGATIGGMELSERNDLFDYGDQSRFGLLSAGGQGDPYGNFFSMCRGKTAYLVMLSGFYFDDGDTWEALIRPNLEALASRE